MPPASKSKINVLSDVLLPTFAFISSASGPHGAAGAQALLATLGMNERKKQNRLEQSRLDESLQIRKDDLAFRQQQAQQKAAFEQPKRQLAASQAQFQQQALQDIFSQVNRPQRAPGGGLPAGVQGPVRTQVPATAEMRSERFGQLATSPAGRAQLQAAGLGNVAGVGAATAQQDAAQQNKLISVKQEALKDLRDYTPDILPPDMQQMIGQGIAQAQTPDELFEIVAQMPSGVLKPKSARIEEYKFYAQQEQSAGRMPVGFLEFQTAQRKAAATRVKTTTNVNSDTGIDYGKPPKDTAWARNPDGSVLLEPYGPEGQLAPVAIPVRGGAAYRDVQEAVEKKTIREEHAQSVAGLMVDDINRSIAITEDSLLPVTGLIGSTLAAARIGDPYNLHEHLTAIRSRIGIDTMQKVREASPTGGAFGNVSDKENTLVQSVYGSLAQAQSKEQLVYNLNRVREIYLDIVHGIGRPNRQLEYLTQEDIATLNEAQGHVMDPKLLKPEDLTNMTPEQLDALQQRLQSQAPAQGGQAPSQPQGTQRLNLSNMPPDDIRNIKLSNQITLDISNLNPQQQAALDDLLGVSP